MDCVDEIICLFETRGSRDYVGEPVSQREHALQTAQLAVAGGASDALVIAALLHDIGHLLGPGSNPAEQGIDGLHEESGCRWLARNFGPEVTEPVRLHVAAKRYLCAADPGYLASLSPASVRSLELQGGPMNRDERKAFESNPFYRDAVRLRQWDDAAKIPGLLATPLAQYVDTLRRAAS